MLALAREKAAERRLEKRWIDGGCQASMVAGAQTELAVTLELASRPPGGVGCTVLPRRWEVVRTFAWLGRNRRLCKDAVASHAIGEAVIRAASGMTMLRGLAPHQTS